MALPHHSFVLGFPCIEGYSLMVEQQQCSIGNLNIAVYVHLRLNPKSTYSFAIEIFQVRGYAVPSWVVSYAVLS